MGQQRRRFFHQRGRNSDAQRRRRALAPIERLENRILLAADLNPWHNVANPLDVDGDGVIRPMDALRIITDLNVHGPRSLSDALTSRVAATTSGEGESTPPRAMLDVNGDLSITPLDVNQVITWLNQPEGENPYPWVKVSATAIEDVQPAVDLTDPNWVSKINTPRTSLQDLNGGTVEAGDTFRVEVRVQDTRLDDHDYFPGVGTAFGVYSAYFDLAWDPDALFVPAGTSVIAPSTGIELDFPISFANGDFSLAPPTDLASFPYSNGATGDIDQPGFLNDAGAFQTAEYYGQNAKFFFDLVLQAESISVQDGSVTVASGSSVSVDALANAELVSGPQTIEIAAPSKYLGVGLGLRTTTFGSNFTEIIDPENPDDPLSRRYDTVVPEHQMQFFDASVNIVNTGTLQIPAVGHTQLLNDQGATIGDVVRNADSTFSVTPTVPGPATGKFLYTVEDGNGHSKMVTVTVTVTEGVNDAPEVTLTQPDPMDEDGSLPLNGLVALDDADAGTRPVTVDLQATNGTLDIASTITGTLAELNAAVQGATFEPVADYNGPASIVITLTDQGVSDTETLTISVRAVNDAPINRLNDVEIDNTTPEQSTTTDASLVFSAVNSNRLSVTDVDGNVNVTVNLNASGGTVFTLDPASVTVTGNGGSAVSLSGLLNDVNNALSSVTYTPPVGVNGDFTLTMITNDGGNTGLGNALDDTDVLAIKVAPEVSPLAVNDSETVAEDSDDNALDVLGNDVRTLGGTLAITGLNGSEVAVDGQITTARGGVVVNQGTQLLYTPADDFYGQDTFTYTVEASDVGDGPSTGTVTVTVTPLNDPPEVTLSAPTASVNEGEVLGLAGTISVSDVDADDQGGVLVTIAVNAGTVAASSGTATVLNSGTGALTIEGLVNDVNTALNGLTYTPVGDLLTADVMTVKVEDQGHTGGDNLMDTATLAITINPVNDPPVLTAPAQLSTNEDTLLDASGGLSVSVADADLGQGTLTVSLIATNGAADVGSGSGVNFTDSDGTDGTLEFTGSLNQVQAALQGLAFDPTADYNGPASLAIVVSDNGNTGPTTEGDAATVAITVDPVNDPVQATDDPGYTTDEDTPLTITIAEILANDSPGPANESNQTLTLTDAVANTGGVAIVGSTLVYTPVPETSGLARILYTVRDNPTDGTTSTVDNATVTISVTPVNDAPQIVAPQNTATQEGTPLAFVAGTATEISVSDIDSSQLTVTVTATSGTVNLAGTTAVTIVSGSDGSSSVAIEGSLSALNAALNGMTFTPTAGFEGSASLTVLADDGEDDASTTVSISVSATNNPPVNRLPDDQQMAEDGVLVFSQVTGNPITVEDLDAGEADVDVTVTVSLGTLTLNASALSGLTTVSGNGGSNVAMRGPLSAINAALDGATYRAPSNYFTTANTVGPTLTVTTNDRGNTGDGGALSDTDRLTITVSSVNDDPTARDDFAADPPLILQDSSNNPLTVLGNDSIAPDVGEQLVIVSVTNGARGTVTHDGTRVFYTPTPAGGVGLDTFTYTISDGNGGTDTATVSVQVVDFTLSSLSGYVYVEETGDQMKSPEEWGIGHVMVTLTGTNMRGDQVHQTAWTDGNGHYEFAGLLPNMAGEHYTLTEHHPTDFIDGAAQVGDQGGVAVDQNTIQVSVPVLGWANGATGSGNNFAEAALKPVYASVSLGDLLRSGGSTTASDRLIWSTDTAGYLQWYINGGGWDGYIPGVATPAGSNTFRVTMTFGSMQLTDTGSGQAHTAVVAGNATSTTANGSTIRKVTAAGTAYGLAPHAYAAAVQNVDETVVSSVADGGQGYTESVDDLFSQLGGLLS